MLWSYWTWCKTATLLDNRLNKRSVYSRWLTRDLSGEEKTKHLHWTDPPSCMTELPCYKGSRVNWPLRIPPSAYFKVQSSFIILQHRVANLNESCNPFILHTHRTYIQIIQFKIDFYNYYLYTYTRVHPGNNYVMYFSILFPGECKQQCCPVTSKLPSCVYVLIKIQLNMQW